MRVGFALFLQLSAGGRWGSEIACTALLERSGSAILGTSRGGSCRRYWIVAFLLV